MYYDASGTDYISTPSFAIPNTGVLTVEAWMKSKLNATIAQTLIGESTQSATVGYAFIRRFTNSDILQCYYADGSIANYYTFSNYFTGLDNQ